MIPATGMKDQIHNERLAWTSHNIYLSVGRSAVHGPVRQRILHRGLHAVLTRTQAVETTGLSFHRGV